MNTTGKVTPLLPLGSVVPVTRKRRTIRCRSGGYGLPVHLAAKLTERVSDERLSSREIDVLKLMAQGKSNKEIGAALFISEGTVKSHVKAIFAKMNVISRTEVVAQCYPARFDSAVVAAVTAAIARALSRTRE
jgi:DNA-binding CsgD family transcriptional regulator